VTEPTSTKESNILPVSNDKNISRRDFLKLGVLALGTSVGAKAIGFLGKVADNNRELLFGIGPNVKDIPSEVPPSLLGLEIPKQNENLLPADLILKNALSIYEDWHKGTNVLYPPVYNRPKNYLNALSLSHLVKDSAQTMPISHGLLIDAFYKNNLPYANYSDGAGAGILGTSHLVEIDPGTGLVFNLKNEFQKLYGNDFDIWSACTKSTLTETQKGELESAIGVWFNNSTEYAKNCYRKLGNKRISSSIMLAYFIHNNNGDILKGIWDTATWFKIAARNEIPTLEYNPNRQKADFLNNIFVDESSQTVSINWVIDNVAKDDQILNSSDRTFHPEWKDYMPVNRAGDFYHFWTIIGVCAVMSPDLAKRTIGTMLTDSSQYGRVKISTDEETVAKAEKIARLLEKYETK
jgi:hypothetical protein